MGAPGPSVLGRGVVVAAGCAPPEPWATAPVVCIDDAAIAAPGPTVASLHASWAARRPVVVELAVDPARFRAPESWAVEPWTVAPDFEAWFDRLHFLVWANTYDARGGEPVWWWATKAGRLGATPTPDGPADVALPDGRPAWVDGGPRTSWTGEDLGGAVTVHAGSIEAGQLTVGPEPVAPTADLAPDQLAAVAHGAGSARVIAPAGSGKTRVLTERLRHLLRDRGYERSSVLAVAYNVKARDELVERTADLGPRVQTLNGLAYGLLADHRGTAPRVLSEREVRGLVEDRVPRHRPRANTDPLAAYLEALTTVRLGLRDPDEVEVERGDVPGLAALFGPYRRALADRGAVDFDEQVYAAVEALLGDGAFRRRAQARHRHLLVDEFQDLTPAHVLMIRLLATPGLDVFAVGDDDQCVYGHSGADPGFLVDYARLFPGAADHPLEVNYRCPVAVVDGARRLLDRNRRRVPKRMRPSPGADPATDGLRIRLDRPEDGAAAVVEEVRAWLAEPGIGPGDVAVLARVGSLLLGPHVALADAGVGIDSILTSEVLGRTGMRAALAYLRIAARPDHLAAADLAEVYRRPSRGLPTWITKWFRDGTSVEWVMGMADRIDDAKVGAKVTQLAEDLALVAAAATEGSTRDVLAVVKDDVGLGEAMERLDRSKGGEGSSQLDDIEGLLQVADLHPEVASFEPWLRATFTSAADGGGPTGAVTLSTVHRVKGREWPRVAVVGATAGVVPHRLAVDAEEERRVLHVAITRGRQRVVVLGDRTRPSPFLAELDGTAPPRAEHEQGAAATTAAARGMPPGRVRRSSGPAAGGETAPLTGVAAALEEELRAWRRGRADGKPAYTVAPNATLRSVAEARPKSLAALGRIAGIGPTTLERYGDELLELVARFADDTDDTA